ncbi:hypothetical protein I4U23_030339 [Adineta vaga]|nr:hypothetical protein I4U23_030339 [Adineta vaga]
MMPDYFTHLLGIIHIIRFTCLIILLIFTEIKISSCGTYLNEFLGFNHQSILFYYILIWISFSFEIYFFLNRLFASMSIKARTSVQILFFLLFIGYLLASSFTLYALINSSDGHVITQMDFLDPPRTIITIPSDCNPYRLIGIVFGYMIGLLYLFAFVLIHRSVD